VEAAAAVWSQEDSSSVDLRPDLPDNSLRMRWVQWVGGSGLSWGGGRLWVNLTWSVRPAVRVHTYNNLHQSFGCAPPPALPAVC
jgi:hypothetical protein